MIYLKMIQKKFFILADLFETQALNIYQLVEIIMVNKYKKFKFTVFQLVTPGFRDFNYSQQFLIKVLYQVSNKIFFFKKNAIKYIID